MAKLVRIKRYNPRKGCVMRSYTVRGVKIQESVGWHEVSDDLAEYLSGVRQKAEDPESPLAFDVCTHDEAKKLDAAEKAARLARTPDAPEAPMRVHKIGKPDPSTMTTRDLAAPPVPRRSPSLAYDEVEPPRREEDPSLPGLPGEAADLDRADLAAETPPAPRARQQSASPAPREAPAPGKAPKGKAKPAKPPKGEARA